VTFTDNSNGNGGTIVEYSWSIDGTVVGSGPVFQGILDPGVYEVTLTVTTSDGCTDSYTFQYIVGDVEIVAPNVFSPNSDGQNDALEFTGLQYYPNAHLQVFNRWGNTVYDDVNYHNN
jgi:PKD repeat protein